MKTVILGGTFNPPHLGHSHTIREVEKALKPDRFIVIPTFVPPHKTLVQGSPTPEQRMEMCRIAFADMPYVTISDIELKRGGASYTVDTLTEWKKDNPDDEIFFVMGSDSLIKFESWRKYKKIFSICTLVVCPRENDYDLLCTVADRYRRLYSASVIVLNCPSVVVSSTEVRRGCSGADHIVPEVLNYIRQNHLYGIE